MKKNALWVGIIAVTMLIFGNMSFVNAATEEGDIRVYINLYDKEGVLVKSTINKNLQVKLYDKKNKTVDSKKKSSKKEINFYDVETGSYTVKCEIPGYVNKKNTSKSYYKTGTFKVKDGKRTKVTCHLRLK